METKITKEIPKAYERIIVEEYYKFLGNLYGLNKFFPRSDVTYTLDQGKWNYGDIQDMSLRETAKVLRPEEGNYFACVYSDEEVLKAIARLRLEEYAHIAEIVFTDYPDDLEKKMLLEEVINSILKQTLDDQIFSISMEVPKTDASMLDIIQDCGFVECQESQNSKYATCMFEKEIVRKKDESTLSRQKR